MACCAVNCKSHSSVRSEDDVGVSFHRFPQNPLLREQWISATGRRRWEPKKHSRLCSKHFHPDCYTVGSKRRELHTNAAPTIFCSNSPEHKLTLRTTKREKLRRLIFSSDKTTHKRRNATTLKCKTLSSDKIISVCRACLAAGAQMFYLNEDQLVQYHELLGVQSEGGSEATMKMEVTVCYECSALLGKLRDLRARARRAHATLTRILLCDDPDLEQSLKEVDRTSLGLQSRLTWRNLDSLSIEPDDGRLRTASNSAFNKPLNGRKQLNELTRLTSVSNRTLKKNRSLGTRIMKKEDRCNHCKKKFKHDMNIDEERETKLLICDSCKEQCQSSVTLFKPRLGQRSTHAYIEIKENSILREELQEREGKMEKIVKKNKRKKKFVEDKINNESYDEKLQNNARETPINTFIKQKNEHKSVVYDERIREINVIDMAICERKTEGNIEGEGNLNAEHTEKVLSDDPLYVTKVDNEISDARMYDWKVETL